MVGALSRVVDLGYLALTLDSEYESRVWMQGGHDGV